jgi:hypothetical protein
LAPYSKEKHGHLAGILNVDPKTLSLIFSAQSTWMLGYPEQALRILDAGHDHARQIQHPFALGWALTTGAQVFDYLREPDEWLKRIEEGDRVARANSLPFLTEALVPSCSGMALIRKGQVVEGIGLALRGSAAWGTGGDRQGTANMKSRLVEGMAQLGDLDGALVLIDEAIAQIERPGWMERHYYAEVLRIRGRVLSLKGDPAGAEHAYIASLDWARTQQAKSWELRTSTSLARTWYGR